MMHIFPKPKRLEETDKEFIFGKLMILTIGKEDITSSQIKLFKELYRNFTCGVGYLKIRLCEEKKGVAIFSVTQEVLLQKGELNGEYEMEITEKKAMLYFTDNKSFVHAFCTLLSLIEARTIKGSIAFTLPVAKIEDEPTIRFRSIKFSIFPETRFIMFKKFLRMAGFAKYTHVMIEFWGTYRYKCCPDMGRKNSYTRRQIKELVNEARALGMELIPILNCFGHAAQNRSCYGKHVALDQNPKLAPYFEPDGWTWNLLNPDTLELLKKMREELMELFGEGEYFHIGCDEAFTYGSSRLFKGVDKQGILIKHINDIVAEMKVHGRRVMMWGDQMLYKQEGWSASNIAFAESQEEADRYAKELDKSIVVVDWQYSSYDKVMPTSKWLSEKGFEVIIATFDDLHATRFCVENVLENGYLGAMQTTWHIMHGEGQTMDGGIQMTLRAGELFWNGNIEQEKRFNEYLLFLAGAYYRKLLPPKGKYKDCGIHEQDIKI